MREPVPYDIFKRDDSGALVWVQAAPDLDAATEKIKELMEGSGGGGKYIVFNQQTQEMIPES